MRKKKRGGERFADNAEADLLSQVETEKVALNRAADLEENLEEGSVDGDSSWFLRHLTEKQRLYGVCYVRCGGQWKKAAIAAGYSASTPQSHIENGDAMVAYMKAIKAEFAAMQGLSAMSIIARLNRIALKAEKLGNLDAAIRANRTLGDTMGLFDKKNSAPQQNTEGTFVTIAGPRSTDDDDLADDPEIQEILRRNGMDVLELPEQIAEVFDVQDS